MIKLGVILTIDKFFRTTKEAERLLTAQDKLAGEIILRVLRKAQAPLTIDGLAERLREAQSNIDAPGPDRHFLVRCPTPGALLTSTAREALWRMVDQKVIVFTPEREFAPFLRKEVRK